MLEISSTAHNKPLPRYTMAVGGVAACFLLRFITVRFFGLDLPPFVLSYPLVMAVAILGGLWAGLLATGFTVLLTDCFVMPPVGHFTISNPSDAVGLGIFAAMGVGMSVFAERYRQNQRSVMASKLVLAKRKSKEALRHASEFSKLALEAADLGTWEFLPESGQLIVDDNFLKIFGHQPGEAYTSALLFERVHPDDRNLMRDTMIGSIAGIDGGLWGMEHRVVWPDGSVHWITSHGRAHFTGESEGRHAARLIGLSKDVTARKTAEAARLAEQAKLEAALASMTDAVFISDASGKPIQCNDSFKTFHRLRIGSDDASPTDVRECIELFTADGAFVPLKDRAIARALRGESGTNVEYRLRHKETGGTWVGSYSFGPLRDSTGAITGSVVVARDITENKRAEDALRKSEILHRGLFESMEEGFFIIELIFDSQGTPVDYLFLEVNAAFERQTGMRDSVGRRIREVSSSLDPFWPEFYAKVARTGEPAHAIHESKAVNRTIEARAYRVGEPGQHRVAVVFEDITERVRAHEVLRQQAELIDLAHDTIMVRDLSGAIRFWNHGAEEMCGFSSEEARGRISHELLRTVFPRPLAEIRETVLEAGRWEGELTHIARNGARIEVASRWALQRDLEGTPTGVLEIDTDISKRKSAEEHTRKLNRAYTVLSDVNQTIVREKDSTAMLEAACRIAVEKGKFRMAWIGMIDSATQELQPVASGGKVDGYLERVRIDFLDPTHASGPAAKCFLTGNYCTCDDIEHELQNPWTGYALRNGYKSMAAFPLKCEGQITGIFCLYADELAFFDDDEIQVLDEMAMDISYALEVSRHEEERQKVDEELRWRTAFFEAQVESAIDGILVVNTKGEKLFRNQRLIELFGIPADIAEAGGSSQRKFVESVIKNPQDALAKIPSMNAHPEEISRDEIELVNGTILERYSAPVIDRARRHHGRIWTFRDITERRQLEEQFRQAQKMEAIGLLTGGIAHDFNNLLTVILGCSEVMGDEVTQNPRLGKMVELIRGAAQRGADLTHRMLAFARRQALQPRPVNINQLLTGMENFLRRALTAEITLRVIPGTGECDAIIDPAQLESALINLCINARDAMPQGGRLTIETSYATLDADYAAENPEIAPGEYILIAVSDTGNGISRENLKRVFDPFFTTKEIGKGTGLGLSMVYGFVKQSRGHVKIYSAPGLGTSVKLYLPRAAEKSAPCSQEPAPFAEYRGSEVILLVEDDDAVREIARSRLVDLGYRVLVAANGKDALELLQAHAEIHLLFTDMAMPGGMNGRELATRARELRSDLKVLVCSGYADSAIFEEEHPGRQTTVLSKPYSRLELAKKVREALTKG